jgi:hypothetical protein
MEFLIWVSTIWFGYDTPSTVTHLYVWYFAKLVPGIAFVVTSCAKAVLHASNANASPMAPFAILVEFFLVILPSGNKFSIDSIDQVRSAWAF